MAVGIDTHSLPDGYAEWRNKIENLIEKAKLNAAIHVNTDMLSLYWSIGSDIIRKKKELGWGAQVIEQLSVDLTHKFPEDKGYSVRNLHYMRRFAENSSISNFISVETLFLSDSHQRYNHHFGCIIQCFAHGISCR